LSLEAETEVEMEHGHWYGGQAESRFRGILEMRTDVGEVDEGHGDALRRRMRRKESAAPEARLSSVPVCMKYWESV